MSLIEGCKHELEITIPSEEVRQATERVIGAIQQKSKLPGFRPGKAPASLIRGKFQPQIRQDVLDHLLPKALEARIEEDHLKVVSTPNVTDVHFHEGEPLRFKADFEVAPEIEIGEYKGLEVPYGEPKVPESDIDRRIESLRDQKAEFVNEDPRPLRDGDHAVVALKSLSGLEGDPIESNETVLHLGGQDTLPEFSENLRGMSPDEEKDFAINYPADYGQERLAGKTVGFHVRVRGVRRREVPEANDEFARDLGDFQTLDELREAVRRTLGGEREHAAQQAAKNALVGVLVDRHVFPVPEVFIERQIQVQVEGYLRQVAARGVDPRTLTLDWPKIRASQREQAVRDVRGSLLLEKVADTESIYATNDEMDREIQRIARADREPVAAVRMRLEKEGSLARIASRIRTEKTLNFLFEHARKTAAPDEAD